jgi:hypothetical protein
LAGNTDDDNFKMKIEKEVRKLEGLMRRTKN